MVSFIRKGSEIANLMGYCFKTKSAKLKAKQFFQDKIIFLESQDADH